MKQTLDLIKRTEISITNEPYRERQFITSDGSYRVVLRKKSFAMVFEKKWELVVIPREITTWHYPPKETWNYLDYRSQSRHYSFRRHMDALLHYVELIELYGRMDILAQDTIEMPLPKEVNK
jgi:hypothetical protein